MGTETDTPQTTGNCAGCDPGGLACSTEMYKRQAEVAEESAKALDKYQEKFESARAAYAKARADAKADVEKAKQDLETVKQALCKLSIEDRKCLRDSYNKVYQAIKDCSGTTGGCCVGDCSYPTEATDSETTSSLAGLIDQYRQAAATNQACFANLIKLLDTIPAEITTLKKDVGDLVDQVGKAADKDVLVRLYAKYLVVRLGLEGDRLFGGFTSVNAYVDCLCRAMQCSYAAWQAVIELEGRKARLDCEDRARKAECERKRKDIVEDILCEYEKCKPTTPSDPGTHEPDCGCGQHHGDSVDDVP
ncbi:hypothetical protein EV645_6533 [Kribbella rubisoli]|uniref:Uncharacterized protein n=1 Tax=Kribbella rubisoli TaxID=3075929 RepID=A0A4Q7WML5_9ACTN|nr:hypothetical protein [Kribbella rubisoli]RZU11367.1 hypothetical protein EV645_6533 [Kribbella rubisoli]